MQSIPPLERENTLFILSIYIPLLRLCLQKKKKREKNYIYIKIPQYTYRYLRINILSLTLSFFTFQSSYDTQTRKREEGEKTKKCVAEEEWESRADRGIVRGESTRDKRRVILFLDRKRSKSRNHSSVTLYGNGARMFECMIGGRWSEEKLVNRTFPHGKQFKKSGSRSTSIPRMKTFFLR